MLGFVNSPLTRVLVTKVVEVMQADVHTVPWWRAGVIIAVLLLFAICLTLAVTVSLAFQPRISPSRRNNAALLVDFDPVGSNLDLLFTSRPVGHRFSSPLHDLELFGLPSDSLQVVEVVCFYRCDV